MSNVICSSVYITIWQKRLFVQRVIYDVVTDLTSTTAWTNRRDLAVLEMMIKQHRELKGKIDGRSKTIQQCGDLGKILIAAGDSASEEVSRITASAQIPATEDDAHTAPLRLHGSGM